MGYRVVTQTLFPVRGGNPEVLIARDRQASIGPLLDNLVAKHVKVVLPPQGGMH